jgi:LysM repeat protein
VPRDASLAGRPLSAPTRPETVRRSEPETGLLQPVRAPQPDGLSLLPATREYTVQRGDNLIGISRKEGVALSDLLSANGLRRDSTIYVGQVLLVPESGAGQQTLSTTEADHAGREVEVRAGDTLSAIAARHGTTVAILKSLNGLTRDTIYVGQKLLVPESGIAPVPQQAPAPAASRSVAAPAGSRTHTVKAGETPSGIARQYGISATELMAANNISDPRRLLVGMELVIPRAASAPSRQPAQPAAQVRPASPDSDSVTTTPPVRDPQPAAEEDPMSALESLEDEDLPFVEVEAVEDDTPDR